jgi:acetolactate synthase-1/2/3 large subunit
MVSIKFNTATVADGILLVSGSGDGDTGGGLCALDVEISETVDRVSTAGITLFGNQFARLLRTPLNTGGGEILIYDSRGVSRYLRVDELSDPHYMAWDGQHLIVSSTGQNSLLWITLGGEVVRRWRAPGEDDSWHLNDICLVGQNLYACAFGRYSDYRGYKDHLQRGDGIVFDIASGRNVVTGLCAPHSPRYFDSVWTVCDSLRNTVVQVDAEGHRTREAKLRAFARGLAVTDDYLIVGESVQRGPGGGSATGSVAILRRSDFSFVVRWDVPFREVSEIVVAPRSLVHAVKTGFRTNPLRVNESDQLRMFRDIGMEPKLLWAVSERLNPDKCKVRIDAKIPSSFIGGKLTLVECTVQNLSDAFLCSELPHPVHIAYRWKNHHDSTSAARDNGNRLRLPNMLPPGSSIHCLVEVLPPDVEGEFEIVITLVQESVAWFDDIDALNGCSAMVKVIRAESSDSLPL